MPKASILQSSFSSGEVSPLFYGQAINPRYKKGLASGLNFLPILQGPLVRRPGTKFCAQSKYNNAPPLLVPFVFSQSQAYVLEFGSDGVLTDNQYIRFYANNGQIVTTAASVKVYGLNSIASSYNDPSRGNEAIGLFYASRALNRLQAGEFSIQNSTAVASGSLLEIQSPYLTRDLPLLRWVQKDDTLYLFHPHYPPYKLQRQAQEYWKLSQVVLQDGPYFALNTYQTFGDCANFSMQLLSFSPPPLGGGVVQTLGINITNAVADGVTNQIIITTTTPHGLLTGQNVYIQGVTGTTEANNWDAAVNPAKPTAYWPIQVLTPTTYMLLGSNFVNAYGAGGISYPGLFAFSAAAYRLNFLGGTVLVPDAGRTLGFIIGGKRYYGYLNSGTSGDNAATWNIVWPAAFAAAATITAWQLGVYSPGFGFPTCGTFHQNRLVLAGAGGAPQEVDGSMSGQFEIFSPSSPTTLTVSDDNAFSFQLNSSDSNAIQWLASTAQGLLAGSFSAEWVMSPSSASDALTPTNFNAQQSSFFGSATAAPVQLGNGTLYIQRSSRKIREMSFFFSAGTFRSLDMTELSEHITLPIVTRLAITKESQPIIWATRFDGALISLVYSRDDQSLIAGWMPHRLGGLGDSAGNQPYVSSIVSIPSPDGTFDQLWLVVQRYINGQTVYYIEYMTKIFDDSFLQEDAVQGDCVGTFYNPAGISAITSANPARVTCTGPTPAWGGLANGDRVRITGVTGLNKSTTDANGNVTVQNLVNGQDFIAQGVVNTPVPGAIITAFNLTDFQGNPVSSIPYGAFLFGGNVAKLVTTISGLTWLKNETISVLADGGIHPNILVDNAGAATLQFAAAKVQLGYGFQSKGKLLRIDAGAPDGTAIGKTRRTTRLAVQLHRAGDLSLGTEFTNLIPVEFPQADVDQADQPMPLFSGMIREGLESAYDFESESCFQMSSMLPGTIQSVTSFMEEFDV